MSLLPSSLVGKPFSFCLVSGGLALLCGVVVMRTKNLHKMPRTACGLEKLYHRKMPFLLQLLLEKNQHTLENVSDCHFEIKKPENIHLLTLGFCLLGRLHFTQAWSHN
jgi:hypothetical protein